MKITRPKRSFVSEDLTIDKWEAIEKYYIDLLNRSIETAEEFNQWLKDKSELDAVLEENAAWRYIKMTINTKEEALAKDYTFFVTEIEPKIAPFEDKLNHKFIESPFADPNGKSNAFNIYHRSVKSHIKLFKEENIDLLAKISEQSQEFGSISGQQTIEHDGATITMQKASTFLKENDENLRKEVFEKMAERRSEDTDRLNTLMSELIQLRHKVAVNAGFENFRDYKFEALGRFDYTKEDCFAFHQAIKEEIVPIVKSLQEDRLAKLGKTKFKPWDTDVDPSGLKPLKPFENGEEMLKGTINMFGKIDPYFADCLSTMDEMNHLDLDSKNGKAPGGYNYPLYEIGVPFIFMNAVGSQRDLVTMVHEGGHAIHSFLSRELELTAYKNIPSEVAELASMSMELLSMNFWDEFYNEEELKRAKKDQLETILKILPWIATIDEFQHWMYENPSHTIEDRYAKWIELGKAYGTGLVDWTGYENVHETSWQRQMHIFEVPFYYIEYGFAQLGALAVWKNSIADFDKAIVDYKEALKLGYSETIPNVYAKANIQFDFSSSYLKELATFIKTELSKL